MVPAHPHLHTARVVVLNRFGGALCPVRKTRPFDKRGEIWQPKTRRLLVCLGPGQALAAEEVHQPERFPHVAPVEVVATPDDLAALDLRHSATPSLEALTVGLLATDG